MHSLFYFYCSVEDDQFILSTSIKFFYIEIANAIDRNIVTSYDEMQNNCYECIDLTDVVIVDNDVEEEEWNVKTAKLFTKKYFYLCPIFAKC